MAAIAVAFATLLKNHSVGDIVLAVALIVAPGWARPEPLGGVILR